jgi:hypothetical protein
VCDGFILVFSASETPALNFMNLFMNKSNESQFKLNIELNWKIANTTPNNLMYVM